MRKSSLVKKIVATLAGFALILGPAVAASNTDTAIGRTYRIASISEGPWAI